jgi:hemerythrin
MSINWSKDLAVGNAEIDDDHRELIAIVNEFAEAAQKSGGEVGDSHMRHVLRCLQIYAQDHFAREEYIQAVAKYDGLEENKREHEVLSRTLADFIARFDAGTLGDKRGSTDQMSAFLSNWLMGHVLKIDVKMKGKINIG